MAASSIADLAVIFVIVVTQALIGRLLFVDWKSGLSPRAFRLFFTILCSFWACIAIDIAIDRPATIFYTGWVPAGLRSICAAIAMVWGFASAISLPIYAVYRNIGQSAVDHSPARRTLIRATGVALMAAPFALTGYGAFIGRTAIRVRETDLPIPDLHPDLEGLRIGQISDLHVSPFLSVREAARAIDMTNELKPQLIAFTGDLISEPGDPLDEAIRELVRLRADAGVLGCLGNHERYARCENYLVKEAGRRGIEFLRGGARQLRFGDAILNVAGVDYQTIGRKNEYLRGAEKLVVPGVANLLLSHNPDVFPVAVRQGYDAMLGGHTHGGQVTVEILIQGLNIARFFTPYVAGLYRLAGKSCYVNVGVGTIGMPVRLGVPPEITLLRLKRA
jgi:predicted MPP superfamily phosphohydrolase